MKRTKTRTRPNMKASTPNKTRGSRTWTRTRNPAINSRMLCQLSYAGSASEEYQRPLFGD